MAEDAGATTVTITATPALAFTSDKTVGINVGMSTDSATEGTDYATVANFNLTIPANQTSGTGTFTLTPVHDATPESDESISVRGWLAGTTVSPTSITLQNAGVPVTLAASPASVTEDGGAKTVTVTATNGQGAATSDIALTIAVGKDGDAAVEGTDYTAVDDFTLTIKKDATTGTGTFTLTPVNDTLYEGTSESLTISGSATNTRVTGTSVAITDDDSASKVTVSPQRRSRPRQGVRRRADGEGGRQAAGNRPRAARGAHDHHLGGRERRRRGIGHRLRGGRGLRPHHPGGAAPRPCVLRPDADRRHPRRRRRGAHGVGNRDTPVGEERRRGDD